MQNLWNNKWHEYFNCKWSQRKTESSAWQLSAHDINAIPIFIFLILPSSVFLVYLPSSTFLILPSSVYLVYLHLSYLWIIFYINAFMLDYMQESFFNFFARPNIFLVFFISLSLYSLTISNVVLTTSFLDKQVEGKFSCNAWTFWYLYD